MQLELVEQKPLTQSQMILEWLRAGKTLTPLEALKQFRRLRLGARAWELRREGHPVEKRMVDVGGGKHVAEYYLAKC